MNETLTSIFPRVFDRGWGSSSSGLLCFPFLPPPSLFPSYHYSSPGPRCRRLLSTLWVNQRQAKKKRFIQVIFIGKALEFQTARSACTSLGYLTTPCPWPGGLAQMHIAVVLFLAPLLPLTLFYCHPRDGCCHHHSCFVSGWLRAVATTRDTTIAPSGAATSPMEP